MFFVNPQYPFVTSISLFLLINFW
uniref:Uncharacterized protein n=1 Tax=Rhizophora mucronata TaxID=61149 RepID=A0A2P2QGZ3_RHIMU